MTALPARLTALRDKWRKEAEESLERWPRGAILPSKKLRACADELAALIASLPAQELATREDICCCREHHRHNGRCLQCPTHGLPAPPRREER